MSRYVEGWRAAIRSFRMARAKKHGAGRAPIWIAMRIAAWDRFIVDGQHCRPQRPPAFMRRSPIWQKIL